MCPAQLSISDELKFKGQGLAGFSKARIFNDFL